MKAAVFNGKEIELKDVPEPIPKENQVLIKIKAVGICGTDLAIINGELATPVPLIPGHEFSGDIVSTGSAVDSSWIGKRVTAEINTSTCGKCYFCINGMKTQCNERKALGIHVNGTFAEYVAIEADLVHEIPENISYTDATMIEPLAAAYQTFETMPLAPEDQNIVIFGTGKMGLLILQLARLKGLNIIAVAGSDKKLELAEKFGAFEVINRHECKNIPGKITRLTNGTGADIVVDTTGNPDALADIVASCRARGKLHIKSTYGVTPINLRDIVMKEITIYTSRCGPFEKAIKGLEKSINIEDLNTRSYKLDDVEEAFKACREKSDHIRAVLIIDDESS
ncbi:MAG: zinc-binding dehydrogenase [Candidatus Odinarchaeota archaeon]